MKAFVVAVAYSGGRDSTALLHATWRAAQAHGNGLRVLALHVHHGLSPHADDWLLHAQQQCAQWAMHGAPVQCLAQRLTTHPQPGESVEAWARRERYRALTEMALTAGAAQVLLAHHQQDQAETFLIQALRGAGMAGLSAMPKQIERAGLWWCRPWLDKPRSAIEAYVRQHQLVHVDDDSNANPRWTRNRLRLHVWPALNQAFPQASATLADAATWAQEAHSALQELAELDMRALGAVTSVGAAGLPLAPWLLLSVARRSNVLRAWLARCSCQSVPSSLVQRLMRELPGEGPASWATECGLLRRYRGRLSWQPQPPTAPAPEPNAAHQSATPPETQVSIRRAGRYRLPGWSGSLIIERVASDGVPLAWLGQLSLKARSGGEQFQAAVGRPARSLKKQYQAVGLPDWSRNGPLVYSGGQLLFVPGLGLDARVLALPGQAQVMLRWVADDLVLETPSREMSRRASVKVRPKVEPKVSAKNAPR